MSLRAVLKVINLFLALGAFLASGAMSLTNGEDVVWAVGKAFACFVACWIILGHVAVMLSLAIEGPEESGGGPEDAAQKNG